MWSIRRVRFEALTETKSNERVVHYSRRKSNNDQMNLYEPSAMANDLNDNNNDSNESVEIGNIRVCMKDAKSAIITILMT